MAHFETVLAAIERDGYHLRPAYPEGKTIRTGIRMGWRLLSKALSRGRQELASRPLPTR
jgi:hypothetical protein